MAGNDTTDMNAHAELTLDDILRPLAIAVVIDHKVKQVEQTTFLEQGRGLLEFFGHDAPDDAALLDWFAGVTDELEDQLWDKGGNTIVLRALTRFKGDAACEAVFDAMVAVSLADRQYVPEESRLIRSAATLYGYPLPPIPVDR